MAEKTVMTWIATFFVVGSGIAGLTGALARLPLSASGKPRCMHEVCFELT